jgi:hypothetical protein
MEHTQAREKKNLLFGRVRIIKESLPSNWRELVAKKSPKYDTIKGGTFLKNVYLCKTADEELTIILEEIAEQHRKEKEAINRRIARHNLTAV